MKIEDHVKAFEQHKRTIFRWALEVLGLKDGQRIIGLHASRGIIELLSVLIHKTGKVDMGFQLNHRWFKSKNVSERLPNFPEKDKIISKITELENLCETLSYGSEKPEYDTERALLLFKELEKMIEDKIGDYHEKK